MIGLFKQRNPILWLALLLYAVVVKWIYFSSPQSVATTSAGGVLFKPLLSFLAGGHQTSLSLRWLGLFLNLVQALQLNGLINRHKMMGTANYLPALSYLTISSAFPQWNDFSSWSLVICLLLWIFHGQFELYQTPQSRGAVYNRCLVWGLLPMFEPAALPFVVWGLIGIWVMRPFRWSEFWVIFIGLLTPYYFLMIWRYWTETPGWYRVFPSIGFQLPTIGEPRWLFAGLGLLAIPTLLGMMQVQSHLRKMLIPVRKGWTHWTIWLIISQSLPFLFSEPFGPGYTALLIPVAAFQACFFYYASLRIVPLLFFWVELFAVLWVQYADRFS
ncbi:MAG: hypothetical protein ACKO6Q_07265 [Bacteroidota bacterium]